MINSRSRIKGFRSVLFFLYFPPCLHKTTKEFTAKKKREQNLKIQENIKSPHNFLSHKKKVYKDTKDMINSEAKKVPLKNFEL